MRKNQYKIPPSFNAVLRSPDLETKWVKPLTRKEGTKICWEEIDMVLILNPPGFIGVTEPGQIWMGKMGDTLVPEQRLRDQDPMYPWYHMLSAIQSIQREESLETVVACAKNSQDMEKWDELCMGISEAGSQLMQELERTGLAVAQVPEMLWVTSFQPLEEL